MRSLLCLLISLSSFNLQAEDKVVGVFYFKPLIGQLRQNSSKVSPALTTLQCGHPVKLLESSKVSVSPEWSYAEVSGHQGFILKKDLAEQRPDCLQSKYPKFFDGLNLDLSDLYYWGRLNDQFIEFETRAQ